MSERRLLLMGSLGIVFLAAASFLGLPYEFGRFLGAN